MSQLLSSCGKWRLVPDKKNVPIKGFYGLTAAEALLALGVLPRAEEVQERIDHAGLLLDLAAGIEWPERIYRVLGRTWVYREVDGFPMYVPVKKVRGYSKRPWAKTAASPWL